MASKRTIVFFDGQNLFHGAKDAWAPVPHVHGSRYGYPCYDVEKLAKCLTERLPGRSLAACRFYTGVPSATQNAHWHGFWTNKLRYLGSKGVFVYRGRINPGGQEKGVDVSIAIDLIRLTYERGYDLAIIVSADWDLAPAIHLAKLIALEQGRRVEFESASPYERGRFENRGLPGTTWVRIDKALYDSCFDPTDYRSRLPP